MTLRTTTLLGLLIAASTVQGVGHARELVAVRVESTARASQRDVPVTVGHAFREGDIAANRSLSVIGAGGRELPVQLDWLASHKDGSLRHGVLTTVLPELSAGEVQTLHLQLAERAGALAPITREELLQSDVDATIALSSEGRRYRAALRPALVDDRVEQWLSGPLVAEWLVDVPFEDEKGARHALLRAQFHVRAYRVEGVITRVRVDVIIENSSIRVQGIGPLTYDVEIRLGGDVKYERRGLTHFAHARWHKVLWWGDVPQAYLRLDTRYLQETLATPKYAELKPSDRALSALITDRPAPMDNLDLDDKLGQTGARPWIGPMTRWDSLYLVTGDRRAWESMIAYNDAWSPYPFHYRDERTGLPVDLSLPVNHRGGVAGTGKGDFAAVTGQSPYVWKNSHAPPAGYMAYLVTGDRYYLDELQFAANANLLQDINVGSKLYPSTWPRVLHAKQIRAQAWGLRTLGLAAYLTPDRHPLKGYFSAAIEENLKYYNSIYPRNNDLGVIVRENVAFTYDTIGPDTGYAPWQHSFFAFSVGRLAEMGFLEARPLFEFVTRWHRGVLVNPDFCWVFAVNYTLGVRAARDKPLFGTHAEIYEANVPLEVRNLGCGSAAMADAIGKPVGAFNDFMNSATSYQANQLPAVAMMATLKVPGGTEAWKLVSTRTGRPKFDDYPNFAVVPR